MSSVKVSFPSVLRTKVGNHASVLAVGKTVRDIINALAVSRREVGVPCQSGSGYLAKVLESGILHTLHLNVRTAGSLVLHKHREQVG